MKNQFFKYYFEHLLSDYQFKNVSTKGVQKKWDWFWCEKSTHSSSKPSSRACRVIDFTLSIQVSCGYHLLLARENGSHERCSKSPSQIWTLATLLPEKKRDQGIVVQFCFLLGYLPTPTYALMKTEYGNDVFGCATIFHWHTFFLCRKTLSSHNNENWSTKNIQHSDYGEHDRSHHNRSSVFDG